MESVCSKYYKVGSITEEEEELLVDFLYNNGIEVDLDIEVEQLCYLSLLAKFKSIEKIEKFKKELKKEFEIKSEIPKKQTGYFDKDTYMKVALNADDRTLLNMLKATKYKFKDSFFRDYLNLNYSNLLKFKPYNQSYKEYYLQAIFYINKLKEEYKFIYSKEDTFNSIVKYKNVERLRKNNLPYETYLYSVN